MKRDGFSSCHPAVNFLFFVGAIGFGVVFQHPAYLLAGLICGAAYYLLLKGAKGLRMLLALLPLCLLIMLLNPLFNTRGERVLFLVFGRPYTLEALLYGGAVAGVFLIMMLWSGCYSVVLTGDKFTSLFGNWIPALSLLLVMVFRMVPGLMRKARQITGARRAVGKGIGKESGYRQKAAEGMTVMTALTSWALEGSIVTADSMRGRGYGAARRSSFQIYRMTARDWALLAVMLLLAAAVIALAVLGSVAATYTPKLEIAPVTGVYGLGLAAYWGFLLIPTAFHLREAMVWHILRSRI